MDPLHLNGRTWQLQRSRTWILFLSHLDAPQPNMIISTPNDATRPKWSRRCAWLITAGNRLIARRS